MALSNQAPATRISLIYLTVGAIMSVWTVIWLIYYLTNPPAGDMLYFVFGFMATGLVLVAIGLGVGALGRSAKTAETPTAIVIPPTAAPVQAPTQVSPPPTNSATVPTVAVAPQNAQPMMTSAPVAAPYARN